jgi:hypothetical protein
MTREHIFTGVLGGFSFYSFIINFRLAPLTDALDGALSLATAMVEEKVLAGKMKRRSNKRRKSTGSTPSNAAADAMQDVTAAANPSAAAPVSASSSAEADIFDETDMLIPFTLSPIGPDQVCFFLDSDGRVIRRNQDFEPHVVAPSFIEFMERYVTDLENGNFAFTPRLGINRFPLKDPCGSDTTTNGIRIQVSALYVPEQSSTQQYFFTYHVRITHDGVTPIRATLVSRHWVIEDADGKVDQVDG